MRIITFILCILPFSFILGQDNDPVLFSLENEEVRVSEFKYIYEKNNSERADYSQQSLDEYLELYKKFKLKVHRARMQGLDTIKTLQKELAGYRKQLAATYLKDKEISERLVDEVVDRFTEDREVSHIFIAAPKKGGAEALKEAEAKINDIHRTLKKNNGAGFGEMAATLSEDKASAKNKGYLGFYTSPLPDGFYEFENAMYTTSVGGFSEPFRSKMGFHIVHVSQIRPARGEMEIAHILVRKAKKGTPVQGAKARIDSVFQMLQDGRSFESLASKYSDDTKNREKGGYLGFFGVNQYELTFENAAFALPKDGSYTRPIETKVGYHIIKRISKRDYSDEIRAKKRIESRINNNNRFKIAEEKLLDDVKKEAGFSENRKLLKLFLESLDVGFYSYKWEPVEFDERTLFSLADKKYDLNDFGAFLKSNVRERLKFSKATPMEEATDKLYDQYVKETVMNYEEANLETKYADFKALMREYREGILLFEITKNEVWDKASKDTIGLQKFYELNKQKYLWPDRVRMTKVNAQSRDADLLKDAHKYAQKKGYDKFTKKYGSKSELTIETSEELVDFDHEIGKTMQGKKPGHVSDIKGIATAGNFYVYDELVKSGIKTLAEARGYVIADYQDYLEKEWVAKLKKEYPITVDKAVLKSLVK